VQIIYAAPFVMLSLFCFTLCAIVLPLRRFALSALLTPVAFGVCSIAGWFAFAVIGDSILKNGLGPASGIHGWIEGVFFYLLPGVMGSWVTVVVVRSLERFLLRTERARELALRTEIVAVAFPTGFLLTLFSAGRWLGSISNYSIVQWIVTSCAGGALASACAYFATRRIRVSRGPQATS
jgi:hypothetical protein